VREPTEPSEDRRDEKSLLNSAAVHLFDAIKVAPLDAITGRAVVHRLPNSLWRLASLGSSSSVIHELKIRLPEGGRLDLYRLVSYEWCPTDGTALYEKKIATPFATLLDRDGQPSC